MVASIDLTLKKNLSQYLIESSASILEALNKMDSNAEGMLICVDELGILIGVLTDGDLRRHLITNPQLDLTHKVDSIVNRNVIYGKQSDDLSKNSLLLNERVKFLPLIDDSGRCVAIAKGREGYLSISNIKIGPGHPCYLIAEIGNNHNGDFSLALKLVDAAKESGANCAKFQMRDLTSLYANKGNASDISEDLGSQYTLDLLAKFQLSNEEMFKVFDHCMHIGITPLCTPWDIVSASVLEEYGIEAYKTASADLTNHELLKVIAKTGRPLICSTGMSVEKEILETVALLKSEGAQYALLHCNSTYPAPLKDINLAYLETLRRIGGCPVGYSSHDRGIYTSIAASALGANIIEKHFTFNKALEGNDHRVSLLPEEFKEMASAIRQVEEAIGGYGERKITQGELMNREALGKSLAVNVYLKPGDIFEPSMLEVKSPGKGLQPNQKNKLIGKSVRRNLKPGDLLFPSDLNEEQSQARAYSFRRKFGIPIRYHDLNTLSKLSNFDLLEFHLSYKDLELDLETFFECKLDFDLVVHAPELFKGEHILDLCSLDKAYRSLSIEYMQNVIDVTKKLKSWFPNATEPRIVINAGGFTQDAPLPSYERADRYLLIEDSLGHLDSTGIKIIPQSMPPFPWHFGGQRFQNLFIDPDEIVQFCERNNSEICLDVSHSKLACNHFGWSFSEFLTKVSSCVSHLHIADASGVDGEGLQIGDGEIDFSNLAQIFDSRMQNASFIPEIWQGHKDFGSGFWVALERLEKYI